MNCAPVLLLIWRRKEQALKSLEAIRIAAPKHLYIACDGFPLGNSSLESQIRECRNEVVRNVDWECNLRTKFSTRHKGCGKGVSTAIDWFFSYEEKGIIVEDDCLLSPYFFGFASEMLDKYSEDRRVWSICADNRVRSRDMEADYFFSRYSYCWGWATWRSRWRDYEFGDRYWAGLTSVGGISRIFEKKSERRYWEKIFNRLFTEGYPDTWDYQWLLTIWVNQGLNIIPKQRLVQNIGFGEGATNLGGYAERIDSSSEIGQLRMGKIKDPVMVLVDREADQLASEIVFGLTRQFSYQWFLKYLRRLLRMCG